MRLVVSSPTVWARPSGRKPTALFSAVSVAVVQGPLTVLGVVLGDFLPEAHIAALTATGGVMLAGIGLRLLRVRDIPVADMLPALLVAPLLTAVVVAVR